MWLLAAGVSGIDTARGPMLNFSDLVLQSAAAGHGVALARSVLAVRYLASGELVRPFEFSLPGKYAYYVVSAAAKANHPKVRKFRDWILEASHEDAVHEAAVVDALRADPAAPTGSGTEARRRLARRRGERNRTWRFVSYRSSQFSHPESEKDRP